MGGGAVVPGASGLDASAPGVVTLDRARTARRAGSTPMAASPEPGLGFGDAPPIRSAGRGSEVLRRGTTRRPGARAPDSSSTRWQRWAPLGERSPPLEGNTGHQQPGTEVSGAAAGPQQRRRQTSAQAQTDGQWDAPGPQPAQAEERCAAARLTRCSWRPPGRAARARGEVGGHDGVARRGRSVAADGTVPACTRGTPAFRRRRVGAEVGGEVGARPATGGPAWRRCRHRLAWSMPCEAAISACTEPLDLGHATGPCRSRCRQRVERLLAQHGGPLTPGRLVPVVGDVGLVDGQITPAGSGGVQLHAHSWRTALSRYGPKSSGWTLAVARSP